MAIKDRFGKLFHKKTETVDAVVPVVGPKTDAGVPNAGGDHFESPPVSAESPDATTIAQDVVNAPVTAEGVAVGEPKAEQSEDEGQVETIPLGEAELHCLSKNGYEQSKGKFARSFLIQKDFWMMTEAMDPTKSKKMVKVKRTAELRAASVKHALDMIGWDSKNVTVVREIDDFKGEIVVLVDNKQVGKIVVPIEMKFGDSFLPFERLCGSARKQFVAGVKAGAMALPEVQAALSKRGRKVSGCSYEHRKHVRLETSKADKPVLTFKANPAVADVPNTGGDYFPPVLSKDGGDYFPPVMSQDAVEASTSTPSQTAEQTQAALEDAQLQADSAKETVDANQGA